MSFLQLALIAIVQGITEWLPVSSSGHVLLFSNLFGVEGRDELLINAVSNLGTLLALLIYFRRDVGHAIVGGFELMAAPFTRRSLSAGAKLALHVIVATPIALLLILLYEPFMPESAKTAVRSVYGVATATIVFGALLWWADAKGGTGRSEQDMTVGHAILIGATQAVAAIFPGTSRSGITMTAARALGYERTEAARFAMLIGAPILAAAGLYGLIGLMEPVEAGVVASVTLVDGLVVAAFAFVSGILSIWGLMALLRRTSFLPFVIYRFVLGGALLLASPMALNLISA